MSIKNSLSLVGQVMDTVGVKGGTPLPAARVVRPPLFLGPLGCECAQHRPTPRPSLERICRKAPGNYLGIRTRLPTSPPSPHTRSTSLHSPLQRNSLRYHSLRFLLTLFVHALRDCVTTRPWETDCATTRLFENVCSVIRPWGTDCFLTLPREVDGVTLSDRLCLRQTRPFLPQSDLGGGVRIHPENARMSGRHGVQYVAQCVACAALTPVVWQ